MYGCAAKALVYCGCVCERYSPPLDVPEIKKAKQVVPQIVEASEVLISVEPITPVVVKRLEFFLDYADDYEECRDFMCGEGTLPDLFSECRMGLAVCERSCRLAV